MRLAVVRVVMTSLMVAALPILTAVALALMAGCAQPAPAASGMELDPGSTAYCNLPDNIGHWPCQHL